MVMQELSVPIRRFGEPDGDTETQSSIVIYEDESPSRMKLKNRHNIKKMKRMEMEEVAVSMAVERR